MKVKITPSSIHGSIAIPSSKSMAHRALICASLSSDHSFLTGIDLSKDIEATISCMQSLGAKIEQTEDGFSIRGTSLNLKNQDLFCDCNESGSTLRFLIPIAALTGCPVTFVGKGRLLQRPMNVYQKIFKDQELYFDQTEQRIKIQGPLKSDTFHLAGDISSQFISGLLFALPLLNEDSEILIKEPYESHSYVDLTLEMLQRFGIKIHQTASNVYHIPGSQNYHAHDTHVEGDFSQMAFFGVLAALRDSLTIRNVRKDSLQGDKAIVHFLENAGANVNFDDDQIEVSHHALHAQTIDLANCPDLGPILCVLASYCQGTTHFIHARRLRMKESDRIQAMEEELKKWGVDISSTEDTITIHGKSSYDKENVVIDGHNDHRIVMAMTIFGLCAKTPSIIDGAQAITKSYPTFFEDIRRIHGKVESV